MKTTLLIACLYSATVLSGCSPVVSVQPLYTQAEIEKPYLDQRLEGDWIMASPGDDEAAAAPEPPCGVRILKSPAGEFPYTVEFRCPSSESEPGEQYSKYDVHLVSLNTATFFDARFAEFEEKDKHASLSDIADKGIAPAHLLGQVWIQQDFIRFALLQSDWVDKNWPRDFLVTSEVGELSGVKILTSQTTDLRNVLSRYAGSEGAFDIARYLCRAGADCEVRAVEEELTRARDNPEVLGASVKFYERRGDFARALVLQRHKIELDSDAAADQYELGRLLLLSGDLDGARRALAAAKEPSAKPSIKELIVQSYFLQGDYAGTVRAAESMGAPASLISADPIILSYFALHRLGRAKEADSFLQQQATTFVGPAEEHLLLLGVLGRVTDSWPSKNQNRSTYYYALDELKNGKFDSGRSHLQDLVRTRPKDDLIRLAAQLELERLGPPATK
jgi:tetratricopeptide (TPR) repeat protein